MITIVGAGPGTGEYMTSGALRVIENSRVLAGGKRILDAIACPADARKIELPASGMSDAVEGVLEHELTGGDVTLVVSGDPGFYSLAKKVVSRFGRERVTIIPGISSVQIMAARLCRSWAGVASVTLHGRNRPDVSDLVGKMHDAPALVALLGAPEEVNAHVEWMTASSDELGAAWAAIGWDLGLPEERIFESRTLKELDACSHKGRLALLWLEGKENVVAGC
jgi:precorrin-6y C5,15-methyltransferase (decarboxylating) CbiE subunit